MSFGDAQPSSAPLVFCTAALSGLTRTHHSALTSHPSSHCTDHRCRGQIKRRSHLSLFRLLHGAARHIKSQINESRCTRRGCRPMLGLMGALPPLAIRDLPLLAIDASHPSDFTEGLDFQDSSFIVFDFQVSGPPGLSHAFRLANLYVSPQFALAFTLPNDSVGSNRPICVSFAADP